MSRAIAALALAAIPTVAHAQIVVEHAFEVVQPSEAVATITASCSRCDWRIAGREAAALKLSIDGRYSQHLLVVRGDTPAEYRVLLGSLPAGTHRLTMEWDGAMSAKGAGAARIGRMDVQVFDPGAPEHSWLAGAPILHARPGTVERFSDVPLLMYAEASVDGQGYDYTVIFSHEDGGTPADRLMATWGRTTDIEFVYGFRRAATDGPLREEYQGPHHEILPFRGRRAGSHPLLWVSTDNNMLTDTGPEDAVRFAPAPVLVRLDRVSREAVMDDNPWLYALTAAELSREGLVEPDAEAGSGQIADARRFAVIEACGDLEDATIAFDLGAAASGGEVVWYPTDRGDARFRIARSGCFRAAVPLPQEITTASISEVRVRAYTRPPREDEAPLPDGTGRVVLRRVNKVFTLDESFEPLPSRIHWSGTLELKGEAPAVPIPLSRR